ncbi:centromere protein C isoform X2 [Diospyros lotus]|uniref:centromere protein C isoform X2 n=1 Tax=Diospyros lotus TaxID=55363 RepID=UPI0022567428|nr:centromere protein C isoform X2 [Diospyros lotus]
MEEENESQSSDPMDPLHTLAGLSLFRHTFSNSTNAPNSDDLQAIHAFMKSVALRNSSKYVEQAKTIVEGSPDLLNFNKVEAPTAKIKENAQERRPALGRRQARFSLKPNSSQSSENVDPSLDIGQLQDPEKYFLAHERLENATKELQRQRGGSDSDLNDYHQSKTERRRRPGIRGKSASYKHHYSSLLPESDDNFISSQETLRSDILSPPNYISQPETADPDVELEERELAGSFSKDQQRVGELLDKLLSSNCENLDGDGAVSLLQEHLQIKPLDLDKLCLPDFHDVGGKDFINMGGNFSKPRKALSDISNLMKGMSGKTPVKHKQVTKSSVCSLASPTPPRSPFASMSLLKKRILQSNPLSDPFSVLNLSPPINSSVEHVDDQSEQCNTEKELVVSGDLKSLVSEAGDIRVGDKGSQQMITRHSISQIEKSEDDNTGRIGVGSNGFCSDLKDSQASRNVDGNDHALNIDIDIPANVPLEMDEDNCRLISDTNIQANEPNEMMEKEVSSGDVNYGNTAGPHNDFQTHGPNEKEVEDMPLNEEANIDATELTAGKLDGNQSQQDKLSPPGVESNDMDGTSRTTDAIPEKHIENIKEPSGEKGLAVSGRRRKTLSHRQSLAGEGTYWESGVRKSKRIKMRPLEYWKGERFLYGRIHESMTTVIGVKYVSPAKGDGKPTVRVQSYVSDKYKELVELAALH